MLNKIVFDHIQFSHSHDFDVDAHNFFHHQHSSFELLYVMQGEGTFLIESTSYQFTDRTVFLIPPGKYHVMKIPPQQNYERCIVNFSPELLPHCMKDTGILCKKADAAFGELFLKADKYADDYPPEPLYTLLLSFLSEALILLAYEKGKAEFKTTQLPKAVTDAIEIIEKNKDQPLTAGDIAKRLFVSETYLHHIFSRTMNISLMRYLRIKKMYLAREYLLRGTRPSEVCTLLGYKDYPTFFKNYRAVFNASPSEDARR